MGIISSKLVPVAVRLAWICQMLLDPRYSSIESKDSTIDSTSSSNKKLEEQRNSEELTATTQLQQQTQQSSPEIAAETTVAISPAVHVVIAKPCQGSPTFGNNRVPENNNSLHQENRNRRAAQVRFKTRPSSFDAALIIRSKSKNPLIVTSTPSPLRHQNMRMWDVTSSSGCSSDTASNSDLDSETELRVSENVSNEEGNTKLIMSAEEEEAFRLTVGRGHFSRSKKDRFLNHLRLEKRLNDLNQEYFGIACKNHRHILQRRHSGDLHKII